MSEALFLAFEKLGVLGTSATRPRASAKARRSSPSRCRRSRARAARRVLGEVVGYGTAFVAPEESTLVYRLARGDEARHRAARSPTPRLDAKDVDLVVVERRRPRAASTTRSSPAIARRRWPHVRRRRAEARSRRDARRRRRASAMAAALAWLGGVPVATDLDRRRCARRRGSVARGRHEHRLLRQRLRRRDPHRERLSSFRG